MIKTYKNINISAGYQIVSAWNIQKLGPFLWAGQKMNTNSGNAMIEAYKNINISVGYHRFCTKPSEQGSFFWAGQNEAQIVVYYYWNLQKHKYFSRISTLLHKTCRTMLIFWAGQNEPKEWYTTIESYKNINISVGYQHFCTKPSETGLVFRTSWNDSK